MYLYLSCVRNILQLSYTKPIWISIWIRIRFINLLSEVEPQTECLNGCNINNNASFPRRRATERLSQLSQWQRWEQIMGAKLGKSLKTQSAYTYIYLKLPSWLIATRRRHNKDERTLVRCQEVSPTYQPPPTITSQRRGPNTPLTFLTHPIAVNIIVGIS